MKKLILILFGLYILSGCATHAQRQAQQMQDQLKIADQAAMSCKNSVDNSASVQRLKKRFISGYVDPRTVEKLTINEYVTEQEINDILEVSALMKPCNTIAIHEFGKAHSEFGIAVAVSATELDANSVKLIKKEITIAEYNQRILDRINRTMTKFSQIQKSAYSQLNESHQQEIAQRQRAAEAQQRWAYQQQLLNSLNRNRTTTTDCHAFGTSVQCTTY